MIKKITVVNYLGDSMELDLMRPELSGFIVKDIKGLGPGKADINTTEISTNDGSLLNSARVPTRNVVLTLGFLWKNSIEDVRQLSYKFFPLKKTVKLIIETDNRIAEVSGVVESNEPNIFSKDEDTDISILCTDPFFYSTQSTTTVFSGIEPAFEFPFSNESLTENLLELSRLRQYHEKVINYKGDSDVGIRIVIHAIGEASGIVIYNLDTREVMRINTEKIEQITGSGIVAGDDIIISTVTGSKSVQLLRDGVTTNILNCLDKTADWFKLTKGDNIFAYSAETGDMNLQFSIENRVVYEGV